MACSGAVRIPMMTFTKVGKKTTIPTTTEVPTSPRRKMSIRNGVMATSGTERSAIAIGMRVCSIDRLATTPMATTIATAVPAR